MPEKRNRTAGKVNPKTCIILYTTIIYSTNNRTVQYYIYTHTPPILPTCSSILPHTQQARRLQRLHPGIHPSDKGRPTYPPTLLYSKGELYPIHHSCWKLVLWNGPGPDTKQRQQVYNVRKCMGGFNVSYKLYYLISYHIT